MRRLLGVLSFIFFGPLLVGAPTGTVHAQDSWLGGSPLRARIRVDANGETWVGVWVDAPTQTARARARAPMAVSLVIDTSGSMAGEKIQNARMAAASFIETLSDGDIVSIYGFSNGVVEFAPPTVLSRGSRGGLMQSVQRITAAGGTNMWDGMQVGIERTGRAPATHTLRRVFLISDGHANIGPSDPVSLGNLAAGATEHGTQITAIGVGYDYDQHTLGALAVRSSGRVHHLGRSHQMASILEQELNLLARSVALNAFVEVVPASGVTILEGATSGATIENGCLRFPLGALHAGQRREVLFRARIDTRRLGAHPLATAQLRYETPDERARREQAVRVSYQVTRDATESAESVAPRVAAMVSDHEAVEAQRRAAALMREGRAQQASVVLRDAQRRAELDARAAPAPARARIQRRARELEAASTSAGAARSRAAMQQRSYEFEDSALSAEGY